MDPFGGMGQGEGQQTWEQQTRLAQNGFDDGETRESCLNQEFNFYDFLKDGTSSHQSNSAGPDMFAQPALPSSAAPHPAPSTSTTFNNVYRDTVPASTDTNASFLTDNGWDDQDLLFTPLLSPAMTNATSSFSPAVHQSGCKPATDNRPQHDSFEPLTSPALRPQLPEVSQALFDPSMLMQMQAHAAAAFLQGQKHILQSIGLGHLVNTPDALAALVASQTSTASAVSAAPNQTSSTANDLPPPRDPAYKPNKGRGASRTAPKTRPSPLMRPVNATTSSSSAKASVTSSPRKPRPQQQQQQQQQPAQPVAPPSAAPSPIFPPSVFSSVGAQPLAQMNLNDSPSPIDLNNLFGTRPPSASNNQDAHQEAWPSGLVNNAHDFAPITPSTLMKLPGDVSMLHGLSPALQPVSEHAVTGQQQQQRQQQQQEQETPDIPLHQQQKPASQSSAQETAPPPAAEEKKNSRKLPNRKTTATSTAQTAATKIKGKQKAKAQAPADLDEPVDRKASHKNAEQRRRDSLKECFEELRHLLPHIPPEEDEEATKRPGEGNIGGQRSSVYDPEHPNKGVSKVALLRKSNVYLQALGKRIARRDAVIQAMQTKLERAGLGLDEHDMLALDGLSLDAIDEEEYGAWPYPKVDQDELPVEPEASLSRRPSRRKMNEAAISYDKT